MESKKRAKKMFKTYKVTKENPFSDEMLIVDPLGSATDTDLDKDTTVSISEDTSENKVVDVESEIIAQADKLEAELKDSNTLSDGYSEESGYKQLRIDDIEINTLSSEDIDIHTKKDSNNMNVSSFGKLSIAVDKNSHSKFVQATIQKSEGQSAKQVQNQNTEKVNTQTYQQTTQQVQQIPHMSYQGTVQYNNTINLEDIPYISRKIVTSAERTFFHFLKENLDMSSKVEIFTKVNLWDLLEIDRNILNSDEPRQRIKGFHADYVICDKNTLEVLCVVELDDYTHNDDRHRVNDSIKNTVLNKAGIKLFRVGVPVATLSKNDIYTIDMYINGIYAPVCPNCGRRMVPRKDRYGKHFFGCVGYALRECSATVKIEN